ncbi:MAG: hypothetical protein AAFS01_04285 [Pseudomonadota bacterium]
MKLIAITGLHTKTHERDYMTEQSPFLSAHEPSHPLVEHLYDSVDGTPWVPEDETPGRVESRCTTYGELTERGAQVLVDYLCPTPQDVFCDIGSGAGRLTLQVAALADLKRCRGIEYIASRHHIAQTALAAAQHTNAPRTSDVEFIYGDALNQDYSDVTLAFLCATCFSAEFLAQLAPRLTSGVKDLTIVSLAEFPGPPEGFHFIDSFVLHATWAEEVSAYVYLVPGTGGYQN